MSSIPANPVEMDSVCRLCADVHDQLVPLFEGEGQDNNLPDRISKYLDFSVHLKSGLPSSVCHQCTMNILNWHQFYKNCERINDNFHLMLMKRKREGISITAAPYSLIVPPKTQPPPLPRVPTPEPEIEPEAESEDIDDVVGLDFDENSSAFNKILREAEEAVPDDIVLGDSLIAKEESRQRGDQPFVVVEFEDEEEATTADPKPKLQIVQEATKERKAGRRKLPRSSRKMKRSIKKPLRLCPYCVDSDEAALTFASERQLDDHLRAQHPDRVFECEMCQRVHDRALLIEHMKGHVDEDEGVVEESVDETGDRVGNNKENRRFPCSYCDRSFDYKCVLKRHVESLHSEDRPYICPVCVKGFKTHSGLYNHKKLVHDPVYSFQCHTCLKLFKLQHELTRHVMTVHEKVFRYFCDVCSKGFMLQDSLTKHRKTHEKGVAFSCSQCPFQTTQKRYLVSHGQRKHPGVAL